MDVGWIVHVALAAGLLSPAGPAGAQDEAAATAAEQAARGLPEGFRAGDLERLERCVHPSLQRVAVQALPGGREVLDFLDRQALLEYARLGAERAQGEAGAPPVQATLLELRDNAAALQITSEGAVDFVHVARLNGAWQVVNVLSSRSLPLPRDGSAAGAHAELERAGRDYVDGFYAGDAERIAGALHPRLQKVMVQALPNGREILRYTSADGLAEYARAGLGRKPEEERAVSVRIQAASEDAASIRVDSADFVDLCHVARLNGAWRIVNVLWVPKAPG